jgi:hypothetical protein
MGVACGPREVDLPSAAREEWCARGPNEEQLGGRGSGPHALLELTVKLREL